MLNTLCKPKEKVIGLRFIPVITGVYICSINEGNLIVLPIIFGGFGPLNYHGTQNIECRTSK